MIMMMLMAYFLGGGLGGVYGSLLSTAALQELSAKTETIVVEERRNEEAQAILKGLSKEVGRFERKFARTGRQLNRAYKRHDWEEDKAMSILNGLNDEWEILQRRAIGLRFELRDQLTEEEWNRLFEQRIPDKTH